MGLTDTVETWLWQVAAKKVALAIVKGIIAIVFGVKVAPILNHAGVTIDQTALSETLMAAVYGGLEFVHDWLKVRTGVAWL